MQMPGIERYNRADAAFTFVIVACIATGMVLVFLMPTIPEIFFWLVALLSVAMILFVEFVTISKKWYEKFVEWMATQDAQATNQLNRPRKSTKNVGIISGFFLIGVLATWILIAIFSTDGLSIKTLAFSVPALVILSCKKFPFALSSWLTAAREMHDIKKK